MNDGKHLSETGFHAGRRLCLSSEGESIHAIYAPLSNPAFRSMCCQQCLKVWALEAYVDSDEMPQWVIDMRHASNASQNASAGA